MLSPNGFPPSAVVGPPGPHRMSLWHAGSPHALWWGQRLASDAQRPLATSPRTSGGDSLASFRGSKRGPSSTRLRRGAAHRFPPASAVGACGFDGSRWLASPPPLPTEEGPRCAGTVNHIPLHHHSEAALPGIHLHITSASPNGPGGSRYHGYRLLQGAGGWEISLPSFAAAL